ncbi:MAG: HPr family phosphocarrier protein [bacterium]
MIERQIIIKNKLGMHARPAALFAQTAAMFEAHIRIAKKDIEVNGKSVMGLMMLAAEHGSTVRVSASGRDEETAMAALEQLFERKFDEE